MEEQAREGIVWDKWILPSTEIQCQILWKGLFTQPLKLLFTHSHTSSHRFQLSTPRPVLSAQDCVRVMQRMRDAGWLTCLWGSYWQVVMTLDSSSLSSGSQQLFEVFLCRAHIPGRLAEEQWCLWCILLLLGRCLLLHGSCCGLTRAWFSKLDGSCTFLSLTDGSTQALLLIVIELFFSMTSYMHISIYIASISVTGLYIITPQHRGKVRAPSLSCPISRPGSRSPRGAGPGYMARVGKARASKGKERKKFSPETPPPPLPERGARARMTGGFARTRNKPTPRAASPRGTFGGCCGWAAQGPRGTRAA